MGVGASPPPPCSTWLVSYGIAAMLRRGICSLACESPKHTATHHSPQNSTDTEAEVDKFINDNNEDNEDDDNINN